MPMLGLIIVEENSVTVEGLEGSPGNQGGGLKFKSNKGCD